MKSWGSSRDRAASEAALITKKQRRSTMRGGEPDDLGATGRLWQNLVAARLTEAEDCVQWGGNPENVG
jgi:hypothetical protein